ncbi:hypothetical protein DES32_2741 [Methylovirgula ligni]|uniref:4-amino-4-deoxy-L-arabinose transferase-like glycosyltransferase n=1 Tax=Methylovirgula ligni TaxID=569860 RepID=A0A3D9YRY7_9HYPH|nr:hypothetical protein [Methylovirgula ligni]REF84631.1 hypothetical protein DES32_2741 [Methylovirgula ligni]
MAERLDYSHPAARFAPALAFLLALCAFLSLFHDIYVDDAYIALAYARSFAASGTWGMHPGFVSNAATSPLDVLLLSGFIKLGFPGVWAVYVFECVLAVVIFCALTFLSRRVFGSDLWAYLGTLALFTNPLLISTSGLETYLFVAVLLGCVIAFLAARYFLLGLAAGLLVLARPDGVLLLAPLFALMVWEKRGLDFVKVLVGFGIVVGAWGFVSWLYLGSAIPDTYFIKRKEAAWHDFSFANGLVLYYFKYPLATLLSLAPALFIPFALPLAKTNRDWRAFVVLAGGLALVHYAAYSLLNLPPYHWYYGIFISALALIGAGGLVVLTREGHAARLAALGLAAILALAGAVTCAEAALARKQMPIHTNLGTVAQYRAIGEWLNANMPAHEYRIIGELGVIQYYGHADAVNSFSDRQILRDFAAKLPEHSPGKWLAELNFAHLTVRPPVGSDYRLEENCKDARGALKTWTTSSIWIDSVLWCLRRESPVSPASPRPD